MAGHDRHAASPGDSMGPWSYASDNPLLAGTVGAQKHCMLRIMSFAAATAVLGCFSLAWADVPKPEDVATCNSEAKAAVQKGHAAPSTPAPTASDHRRADEARGRNVPKDATDTSMRSSDPQIEGMDAHGAKDPIYQAAYRSCMRRSGY